MGMGGVSGGGGGGGRRGRRRKRSGVISEINITPMVDVMLVLLIIMMLIAPMLQQGGPVTLPEAGNTGDKPDTQDQTVVAVDAGGKFYVNALPSTAEDLIPKVQRALEGKMAD